MSRLACVTAVAAIAIGVFTSAQSRSADEAFQRFWAARDRSEAAAAVDNVLRSGVTIADAVTRLKRGPTFPPDPARRVVRLSHAAPPLDFAYSLDVPATYTPSRKYQVRLQLHGGISRPDPEPRGNG